MLLILYLHKHQWHIMVFINKIVLTFNMHGRVSPGTEIFIGGLMTVNLTATSSQFDIEIIWVSFSVFCPKKVQTQTSKWNDLTKRCIEC